MLTSMGLELTMKMPLEGWTFASTSAKGVKWMLCVRAHISANNSANNTALCAHQCKQQCKHYCFVHTSVQITVQTLLLSTTCVSHLQMICASALFTYTCICHLYLHFFFALGFVCATAFCTCSYT